MNSLPDLVRTYLSYPSADGNLKRRELRAELLAAVSNPHYAQSAFSQAMYRLSKAEERIRELERTDKPVLTFPAQPFKPTKRNDLGFSTKARRRFVWNLNQGKCLYCDAPVALESVTIDHIYPKSKGGSNRYRNLAPACSRCNRRKGSTPPTDEQLAKVRARQIEYNQRQMMLGLPQVALIDKESA